MSVTDLVPSVSTALARDRRAAILTAVLGAAVATQVMIALAYGSAPMAARDTWPVALGLSLLLLLPSAGVIWATWTARDLPVGWRMGLAVGLTGALMRLAYFGTGPMLEDDHQRYLLDGAMVAHALSPYRHTPDGLLTEATRAPSTLIDAGRSAITVINFPDLRSIYPGAAQALFGLAYLLAPWSVDGLRAVVFTAEVLTALLIWRALVVSGRSPLLVALFWCNPLLAFCLTGQAHIDAWLAPFILAALFATHRRAAAMAGFWLGCAVGVKLWPILLAPLLLRGLWPDRRAMAQFLLTLGGMTLLLCGPLLWASLGGATGLAAYAGGWSANNAPYAWASYLFLHLVGSGTGERVLRALVIMAAAATSLAIAARQPQGLDDLISRSAMLAAALFYLSPAQFPWYAAWFVPLAAASGRWGLVMAVAGLPVYYLFFPLAVVGHRDLHSYGLAFLHLLPVIGVALVARRVSA